MHLWMETYLFYFSVRLGVIVVAVLTMLQLITPAIASIVVGIKIFDPLVELFEADEQYNKNYFVRKILSCIAHSPTNFMFVLNFYLFVHAAVCVLAIYGACKLLKWFLMPFIVMELIRVINCLTLHIVLMIVLKKILNLGVLIAFTLVGGFLILYLGYNWASSVALFQIIELINSTRYRNLYGDDPFAPVDAKTGRKHAFNDTIHNVRVLVTPNPNEINEQKRMNFMSRFKRTLSKQSIISVLPVDHYGSEKTTYNKNKDFAAEYGNWHWSELVGGKQKRNVDKDNNWRY